MKKVIITVVVIALLASICVFTLSGCTKLNEWKDKFIELINPEDGSSNETEEGAFTVIVDEKQNEAVVQEGSGVILEVARLSSNDGSSLPDYLQKGIVATVYPDYTTDKSVNWFLEWGENPKEGSVEDYLTITPESDGSTNAVLTCNNNFAGSTIILFCESRVSGVVASAVCSYVGVAHSINVVCDGLTTSSHEVLGEYYSLRPDNKYSFEYCIYDYFGVELSNESCDFDVQRNEVGSFYIQNQSYNTNTGERTWLEDVGSLSLSSIRELNPTVSSLTSTYYNSTGIHITVNGAIQDYYTRSERFGTTIKYYGKFKEFVDDNWYYEYNIIENKSGISLSFKYRIEEVSRSINLSPSSIEF